VNEGIARRFFDAVVRRARSQGLLSSDHFTVDGTLIEACEHQELQTQERAAAGKEACAFSALLAVEIAIGATACAGGRIVRTVLTAC